MVVGPDTQVPSEQTLAPTTELPWQVPGTQTLPSTNLRQPPAPLQVPSRPQVTGSSATHCPGLRGNSPAGTGLQVPLLLATLHAWQVPLQALLQQTSSTQKPLPHSSLQAQPTPSLFLSTGVVVQLLGAISRKLPSCMGPSAPPSLTMGRTPLSEVRQPRAAITAPRAIIQRKEKLGTSDMASPCY
jgi:hypothetical protein